MVVRINFKNKFFETMRVILCSTFIIGICVMYLSQNVVGMPEKTPEDLQSLVAQTTDPLEHNDGPLNRKQCYIELQLCEGKYLNDETKSICVYKQTVGLIHMYGLCAIKYEYCLIALQKKLHGSSDFRQDALEIYHNGLDFDCLYYAQRVKSEAEGIIWYFELGGLDAETEEITLPKYIVYK